MSLTGQPFKWLTIVIAIIATLAIIVFWNRIRGPRPVRLAGRAALLATGYLTTAVAALVSVNIAYGGLVASWSDLIDNLMPPQNTWQHSNHYRHHGPPAVWAGHDWKPGREPTCPALSEAVAAPGSMPHCDQVNRQVSAERTPGLQRCSDMTESEAARRIRGVRYAST